MVKNGVPSAPTEGMPEGFLAPGQVLGDRYQIHSQLGRGGMGEVWRAFDLKLRVEVALKALLPDLFKDERRRDILRREVRAAREVVSPNVCRIFDLIEVDGRELVSMEYVDGATLLGVLQDRGPLDLKEAQDIASQFLAGLEAIHKVGLIHRDIKPENIMLTRAGRVVVMDFGLARQDTEGGGSVSGTPAYMAPEQAAGQTLDPRADVYAAGVVLAEMVSPEGIKSFESRQSVWEGLRSEPAKLPDSPWAPVLKRAVAKDREGRFNTARTLTRALEDVTLRVDGAEDLHPYPGLASFTEEDAEFFFGREAEVEQMWRKLGGPARMLSLVGPSGAGKSSFVRAGLLAARHEGWSFLVVTPGEQPFTNLGGAVTRAVAGDLEALEMMVRFAEPDVAVEVLQRWRRQHEHAILVVDQFEELFTLNPDKTQASFALLLGRLPLEADVHVLVSMRDDFLGHCHEQSPLTPMFSDLTFLGTPAGGALRRAVVRPATKCGYRFENDDLVEEMLTEVEGERGALPLLAFALAQQWEMRDRDSGILTRDAYHDIGGVGGALARHAEATIDRIGTERIAFVRELFRNLVTAEGTRAVREWNELLSIFSESQSESPEEVLRKLIDARLLTSYEIREEDEEPTRRVEIIHESLLSNWPRLVRWQTQDADSAQLRDQLRQASKTWDEHDRTDDMLWTGAAYREFASWRERYPGGLTELEEAFAAAMTSAATRRKRRRRIAATAAIVLALVIAAVFGLLWRRSVLETRRAEAAKLLALAQVQLDADPTEALAYATSSLELTDSQEARIFALRALWAGPPVLALDLQQAADGMFAAPAFSPDGRWLAVAGIVNENVLVYGEHGGPPIVLGGHAVSSANPIGRGWSRDNLLVTGHQSENRVRVWSMPGGKLVNTIDFGEPARWQVGEEHLLARIGQRTDPGPGQPWPIQLVRWQLPDGQAENLGIIDFRAVGATSGLFDPRGGSWIYTKGNGVYARPLPVTGGVHDALLGRHSSDGVAVWNWGRAGGFFSRDSSGEIILWTLVDDTWTPGRRMRKPGTEATRVVPDPGARWARVGGLSPGPPIPLLDLAGLSGAAPLQLRRKKEGFLFTAFHPRGSWLVAATHIGRSEATFWPLEARLPIVVEGWAAQGFTRDGQYLVTTDWRRGHPDTRVRLWPVPGNDRDDVVDLMFPLRSGSTGHTCSVDPEGRRVLALAYGPSSFLLSADGDEPRNLFGFPASDNIMGTGGFSPSGRLVAAASAVSEGQATLRVWDLQTDHVKVFEQPEDAEAWEGYSTMNLAFVDETTLYTSGANGLLRWNLETGAWERLARAPSGGALEMRMTADRRKLLVYALRSDWVRMPGPVTLRDLSTGNVRSFEIRGEGVLGFSPDGTIWTAEEPDGSVLVGRIDGGEPHKLLGHEGAVANVAVSPDLRWIATNGVSDGTFRLWPMPDLSKPPLHTLSHDELIAKLHSLTNLRVVRDEGSKIGWKVEVGPFPGWAEVPEW